MTQGIPAGYTVFCDTHCPNTLGLLSQHPNTGEAFALLSLHKAGPFEALQSCSCDAGRLIQPETLQDEPELVRGSKTHNKDNTLLLTSPAQLRQCEMLCWIHIYVNMHTMHLDTRFRSRNVTLAAGTSSRELHPSALYEYGNPHSLLQLSSSNRLGHREKGALLCRNAEGLLLVSHHHKDSQPQGCLASPHMHLSQESWKVSFISWMCIHWLNRLIFNLGFAPSIPFHLPCFLYFLFSVELLHQS